MAYKGRLILEILYFPFKKWWDVPRLIDFWKSDCNCPTFLSPQIMGPRIRMAYKGRLISEILFFPFKKRQDVPILIDLWKSDGSGPTFSSPQNLVPRIQLISEILFFPSFAQKVKRCSEITWPLKVRLWWSNLFVSANYGSKDLIKRTAFGVHILCMTHSEQKDFFVQKWGQSHFGVV